MELWKSLSLRSLLKNNLVYFKSLKSYKIRNYLFKRNYNLTSKCKLFHLKMSKNRYLFGSYYNKVFSYFLINFRIKIIEINFRIKINENNFKKIINWKNVIIKLLYTLLLSKKLNSAFLLTSKVKDLIL